MINTLFKTFFMLTAAGAGIYSISVFGTGIWSYAIIGAAGLQMISFIFPPLLAPAVIVARATGILAAIALLLLLVAGFTGGSFNLSPSNIILGAFLALLSVFGLSAASWPKD